MYKWYVCNLTNWWSNEGEDFPDLHIEKFSNVEWTEITNPSIKFEFPIETAILTTNLENNPRYIKAVDTKGQSFYFYFMTVSEVKTSDNVGIFYYECVYTLDTYMTYIQLNLEIIKEENPAVKFVRKFYDRLVYSINNQGILSYELDYVNQKWLGNIDEEKNYQLIRSYVGGTNPTKLWNNNNIAAPLTNYIFKNFRNSGTTATVSYLKLSTPDNKNRFSYIIAKSSALLDTTNKPNYVDDTYIVIPMFEADKKNILSALQNIGITTADVQINALSAGNFIARKSIDLPFTAFLGKTNVELEFATNKIPNSAINQNIFYFRVPYGFLNSMKIFDYSQYENGLEGKIKYFINNLNYWDEKTEPKLLNPEYYQEKMVIDNDKFISTDISLIKYKSQDARFPSKLSLYMDFAFETDFVAFYDFKEFNNESNINWNNNYSNLRSSLAFDEGLVGSSTADYYDTNKTTLSTSAQNLKEQQGNNWKNYAFDRADDYLKIASSIGQIGLGDVITGGATAAVRIGAATAQAALNATRDAINLVQQHKIENRNFGSNIKNIISTPNRIISNAYASSFIPNKIIDGDMLFQLYKYELHPTDKLREFGEIASKGYPYVSIDKFNTYDNRQFMNILHIDTDYNKVVLINILKSLTGYNIFNATRYIYETLSFMSSMKRLYKNEQVLNVINPSENDYVPNIENILPEINPNAIQIKTLFTITDLSTSYFFTEQTIIDSLKANNPNFADALINGLLVEYSFQDNYVIITAMPSQIYVGFVECIYYAYVKPNFYALDGVVKPISLNTSTNFDILEINGLSNETFNEVYDKLIVNITSTRINIPVRLRILNTIGNDFVINSNFETQSNQIRYFFECIFLSSIFKNNTLPNYVNKLFCDFLVQTKRQTLYNNGDINFNVGRIAQLGFGYILPSTGFSQIRNISLKFPITTLLGPRSNYLDDEYTISFINNFEIFTKPIIFPVLSPLYSLQTSSPFKINVINNFLNQVGSLEINCPVASSGNILATYTAAFLKYPTNFKFNLLTSRPQNLFTKSGTGAQYITYSFSL